MVKYSSKGKDQQDIQKGSKKEYFDKLKVGGELSACVHSNVLHKKAICFDGCDGKCPVSLLCLDRLQQY